MRGLLAFLGLGMVIAMPVSAQMILPAGRTFPRSLEADDLAPLPKAPQVSESVAVDGAAGVSATASPFVVKGVVVTLSDTTGFARDEALEKAAEQALPGVLQALPMDPAKAAKTAKTVGSAMRFVSSYTVVKETVIPVYSLTTDLTFNEAMLHKNFGGLVKEPVAASSPVVGSMTHDGGQVVAAGTAVPLNHWLVRLGNTDLAAVSRVFDKLNGTEGTVAHYRLMTSNGAEIVVDTPLDVNALQVVVGQDATVLSLTPQESRDAVPLPGVY